MQLWGLGHLPLPEAPGTLSSKSVLPRGGTARRAHQAGRWGRSLAVYDVRLDLGPLQTNAPTQSLGRSLQQRQLTGDGHKRGRPALGTALSGSGLLPQRPRPSST